jgi:hypothetical protein
MSSIAKTFIQTKLPFLLFPLFSEYQYDENYKADSIFHVI